MMTSFNPCILIPVYNHEQPLVKIVGKIVSYNLGCILVDDGCNTSCSDTIRSLSNFPGVQSIRLETNQGKGAAVQAGLLFARKCGFSHAVQIDADGQHDLGDLEKFLEASRHAPDAIIIGRAIFNDSIPRLRYYARYLTHLWVHINTLSLRIPDSMCGYRVYPVETTVQLIQTMTLEKRMAFDTQILVVLDWQAVPIISIPTAVNYPEDGVSHFRGFEDNWRLSLTHARLFFGMLCRSPKLLTRYFQ